MSDVLVDDAVVSCCAGSSSPLEDRVPHIGPLGSARPWPRPIFRSIASWAYNTCVGILRGVWLVLQPHELKLLSKAKSSDKFRWTVRHN
jgi:hypothetical protein